MFCQEPRRAGSPCQCGQVGFRRHLPSVSSGGPSLAGAGAAAGGRALWPGLTEPRVRDTAATASAHGAWFRASCRFQRGLWAALPRGSLSSCPCDRCLKQRETGVSVKTSPGQPRVCQACGQPTAGWLSASGRGLAVRSLLPHAALPAAQNHVFPFLCVPVNSGCISSPWSTFVLTVQWLSRAV